MNYCQFRNETIKRMANAGGGLLPAEYQQVEYLEAVGAQYINTRYVPISTDVIKLDYQYTNLQISDNTVFYIDRGNVYSNAYGFSTANNSHTGLAYICGWGTNSAILVNPRPDLNRHTITISKGAFFLDDVEIYNNQSIVNPDYFLMLFGWNRLGGIVARGQARIFRFTASPRQDTTNHYRDFVPCYRISDNKPGMYDLVTQTFFTNAGSGEFTVGNNV